MLPVGPDMPGGLSQDHFWRGSWLIEADSSFLTHMMEVPGKSSDWILPGAKDWVTLVEGHILVGLGQPRYD